MPRCHSAYDADALRRFDADTAAGFHAENSATPAGDGLDYDAAERIALLRLR